MAAVVNHGRGVWLGDCKTEGISADHDYTAYAESKLVGGVKEVSEALTLSLIAMWRCDKSGLGQRSTRSGWKT